MTRIKGVIAEFLEPSLWFVLTYVQKKKKGRFWGEAGAGYLPSGSNKVKVWRLQSELQVDCCSWVAILGSVCVGICRGWAHWEIGVRCVGSEGRKLMARQPIWEKNGLPSKINIMQIVSEEHLTSQLSLVAAYQSHVFALSAQQMSQSLCFMV